MKLYVASSWRNALQPEVVAVLRAAGHEVYDFRNPAPGEHGFSWKEIDGGWQRWTAEQYLTALQDDIAIRGFRSDFDAMKGADAFVLVHPSGRSAHLEAGWAAGAGKPVVCLLEQGGEPELMVKLFEVAGGGCFTRLDEVVVALRELEADLVASGGLPRRG